MPNSVTGPAGTGWVGRWLDGQPAATADLMAATIGSSVPLHLIGAVRRAVAVPENGDGMFGTGTDPAEVRMFTGLRSFSASSAGRGPWHDMFAGVLKTQLDLATDVSPVYSPAPTGDDFEKKMTVAARLINANLGFRVLDLGLDGFDTHDGQPLNHADLLTQLDSGLATFFSTLDPAYYSRVTVVTMSEFGRTPFSNDSSGTDHGTANVQFVMGPNVKGGHYGQPSSFATIVDQWDRFDMTTDFRHVLGTVIDGWMGGGASTILNGPYQNLGFFRTGPGVPAAERWHPAADHTTVEPDRVRLDEPAAAVRHARWHRWASRRARPWRVVAIRDSRPVRRAGRERSRSPSTSPRSTPAVRPTSRPGRAASRARRRRTSTRFPAWPCRTWPSSASATPAMSTSSTTRARSTSLPMSSGTSRTALR